MDPFCVLLVEAGLPPPGILLHCEQARLQLYRKKVQKVESQKWLSENKRSLAVNVSAANRFISHAIPELTTQQHEALREVAPTSFAVVKQLFGPHHPLVLAFCGSCLSNGLRVYCRDERHSLTNRQIQKRRVLLS